MSREMNFTGFEGGDSGRMSGGAQPFFGIVMPDLDARSGEYSCLHKTPTGTATTNTGQYFRLKTVGIGTGLLPDKFVRVNYRVYLRLNAYPVGASLCRGGGVGTNISSQKGSFGITSGGIVHALANDTFPGATTTTIEALQLNRWYRVDLTYINQQAHIGVQCSINVIVNVYTEDGLNLVSNSTHTVVVAANTTLPPDIAIGQNTTSANNEYNYSFDDWFFEVRDNADAEPDVPFPFPTATRIHRVGATSQGSVAQWTGDWRTVTNVPIQLGTNPDGTTIFDEQSNGTVGQTTLFRHDTAVNLRLGNIHALVVAGAMKTNSGLGSSTEAVILNNIEYTDLALTTYTEELDGVDFGHNYTHAQFNAMEFGARNKSGNTIKLGKCYLEVLHDGPGLRAPWSTGIGGYSHKIVSWVGNGTYQDITGIGFGAQLIIVKAVNISSLPGLYKFAALGGTWCTSEQGLQNVTNAILEVNYDGCKLGPSHYVNKVGITYVAIFINDGGLGSTGYMLSTGVYYGTGVDNRAITLNHPFQADLLIIASGEICFRTSGVSGDSTLSLNSTASAANKIQSITSTGFILGSNTQVNNQGIIHTYIALRNGAPNTFEVGRITPTGATLTVTGMTFAPYIVGARSDSSGKPGTFRAVNYHTALQSNPWAGGLNNNTGITSITADGFTGLADVATAGIQTFYFGFYGPVAFTEPQGIYQDVSGLYYVNPAKATWHDSYYGSYERKIPDPTIRTALIGE